MKARHYHRYLALEITFQAAYLQTLLITPSPSVSNVEKLTPCAKAVDDVASAKIAIVVLNCFIITTLNLKRVKSVSEIPV